jgi:hypothetical protein
MTLGIAPDRRPIVPVVQKKPGQRISLLGAASDSTRRQQPRDKVSISLRERMRSFRQASSRMEIALVLVLSFINTPHERLHHVGFQGVAGLELDQTRYER